MCWHVRKPVRFSGYHLLTSSYSTSRSFVQKKAALTLLRLFRKHPDVIPAPDWAERVIPMMAEYDLVRKRMGSVSRCNVYVF
jgi:hypothetical protein